MSASRARTSAGIIAPSKATPSRSTTADSSSTVTSAVGEQPAKPIATINATTAAAVLQALRTVDPPEAILPLTLAISPIPVQFEDQEAGCDRSTGPPGDTMRRRPNGSVEISTVAPGSLETPSSCGVSAIDRRRLLATSHPRRLWIRGVRAVGPKAMGF